jgi:hypothetical protein
VTMLPSDPIDDLRRAMMALKRANPEGWPESVATVAGAVAGLDTVQLDLLADSAVQVAATAHLLAQDADDEMPPAQTDVN